MTWIIENWEGLATIIGLFLIAPIFIAGAKIIKG